MSQPNEENTIKTNSSQKVSMAVYKPKSRAINYDTRTKWMPYGEDNQYPQYLISLFGRSADHKAITTSIASMIAGKPFESTLFDADTIKRMAFDLKLQGGFFLQIIPNTAMSEIATVSCLPFETIRPAKKNENGEIECYYYHPTWLEKDIRKVKPEAIPIFKQGQPLKYARYILPMFHFSPGSSYFPTPDYAGALDAIEMDIRIMEYHNNQLANGFFPSFVIDLFNGDPGPEGRAQVRKDFESLQGNENAGRIIFNFNEPIAAGIDNTPKYNPVPVTDADKQYALLIDLAEKKIMRGHRITSPLLFGFRDGGGLGSNTDEMKTALQIFDGLVIQPFQQIIEKAILIVEGVAVDIVPNVPVFLSKETGVNVEMTDDDANFWTEHLKQVGEVIDTDVWELVSEEDAGNSVHEHDWMNNVKMSKMQSLKFFSEYATPEEKSKWGDSGLYKLRYKYDGPISSNSRPFCRQMMGDSSAGTVYRYEDISAMSFQGTSLV